VASATGPVATGRLRAHLRPGHRVRDQLDHRVAVGERGVPGRGWPEGPAGPDCPGNAPAVTEIGAVRPVVFHGAYAPGHPARVRGVRSERALPRHHLPMGVATSAGEVERRGVRR